MSQENVELVRGVLALGTFRIYGRASGIEAEVPFAIVARIQGGLIVHSKDYGTRALALKAVGLEE
jgi:hypothetical protein